MFSRSLALEDIPAKLRCAICSKLAVNPFRLPCCEQAICDDCQSRLPASCPVCEHSPLSADDCKPHKSLRTTIKVFLRTEEKKRESNRPKDTPPVTPIDAHPAPPALPVVTESAVKADATTFEEESLPPVDAPPTEASNTGGGGPGDSRTVESGEPVDGQQVRVSLATRVVQNLTLS